VNQNRASLDRLPHVGYATVCTADGGVEWSVNTIATYTQLAKRMLS
jgi:hypothetical protein